MDNTYKNIRNRLLPVSFFVPFTFYFILFAVGGYIAYYLLAEQKMLPDTLYSDLFYLFLRITTWFLAIVLGLALVITLTSFLYFLAQKKRNRIKFFINAAPVVKSGQGYQKQGMYIKIEPVLKPFLGFVKLRIKYDGKYTEKFSLAHRSQKKIISNTLEGDYTWHLPEIKEYHIEKLVIYFEDYFQFFSFTVSLPVIDHFYTPPAQQNADSFAISPRRTEETDTRIEELKRVEGEIINYKNFESNDDVRRIVWKIYARNKELVVRIPEILDPYASQAYLYASFFDIFKNSYNSTVDIYFLNYYKTILWAVYQKLAKQGFEIRYISDVQNPGAAFISDEKAVEYSISTGKWQTEKDLKTYVNMKDASVVVITSLSDAQQVEELLGASTGSTFFVLVRLSKSLQRSYLLGLIQWLFIQQEKNELEKYRTNWQLSLARPKITQNEKKLENILSKYDKTIVI